VPTTLKTRLGELTPGSVGLLSSSICPAFGLTFTGNDARRHPLAAFERISIGDA
jgi:hypothetical protein